MNLRVFDGESMAKEEGEQKRHEASQHHSPPGVLERKNQGQNCGQGAGEARNQGGATAGLGVTDDPADSEQDGVNAKRGLTCEQTDHGVRVSME